jgi:hypothetical protein
MYFEIKVLARRLACKCDVQVITHVYCNYEHDEVVDYTALREWYVVE